MTDRDETNITFAAPGFPKPDRTIQMIPAISMPEPKPYYGLPREEYESMTEDQRVHLVGTYWDSVKALKSIYAQLLAPIAVVK